MKNIIASVLALFISFYCFSQQGFIVSGNVKDKTTGAFLQSASVFAENTTIGTATDANGNFKLWLPSGGYNLIVTYTGYETESKRITANDSINSNIIVALGPKEKSMESAVVVATNEVKNGWEKYGSFFTENFIGKTPFSRSCTIENPDVINFISAKKETV